MLGDTQAYNPIVRITNLSGGSSNAFKVGDSWRVDITGGPPNACVYANFSVSGNPLPYSGQQDLALSAWLGYSTQGLEPCGIGKTDSAGNYSTSGTFGSGQVGSWQQTWNIQGNLSNILQFTVADTKGSIQYTGPTTPGGTAYYTQASNHVPTQAAPTGYQTLAQQTGIAITGDTPIPPSVNILPNMPNLTDITNPLTNVTGLSGTSLLLIGGGLLALMFVMKGK